MQLERTTLSRPASGPWLWTWLGSPERPGDEAGSAGSTFPWHLTQEGLRWIRTYKSDFYSEELAVQYLKKKKKSNTEEANYYFLRPRTCA